MLWLRGAAIAGFERPPADLSSIRSGWKKFSNRILSHGELLLKLLLRALATFQQLRAADE